MDSLNFRAPLSAHSRANAAIIALCIFLLYQGLMLIMGAVEIFTISSAVGNADYTGEQIPVMFALKALLGIGNGVIFIATSVFFLMWVHRAHRVLVERSVSGLEFTPAWAVGWFFVPIANLFRPYQAVKEIWEKSDPQSYERPAAPEPEPAEPLPLGQWPAKKARSERPQPIKSAPNFWLPAWWLGWVISGGVDLIASVAFQRASNVILYYGALKMAFLSDVIFVATTALLIVVISKIDNRQRGLSSRQVRPPTPTLDPTPDPAPQTVG